MRPFYLWLIETSIQLIFLKFFGIKAKNIKDMAHENNSNNKP